ncbi:hypothetical protein NDU88_007714 [Pleurodeles waltl]|uniref:Uncharacterized protein n=1 Tax=Pleurodeles waltl TaxID=8319 RepID=A0AAV7NX19_PLEWA|nr:hypothetical protein NDU88_007714 [Pleurodeles waltl]
MAAVLAGCARPSPRLPDGPPRARPQRPSYLFRRQLEAAAEWPCHLPPWEQYSSLTGNGRNTQTIRRPPELRAVVSPKPTSGAQRVALVLDPLQRGTPSDSTLSHQLLFSEDIALPRPMALPKIPPSSAAIPADSCSDYAMERILQEITAVCRRLEAMDSKITDLSLASTSIRVDIASFQDKVTDLDHHLTTVEGQLVMLPDWDSELQFLFAKITDREDRSRSDNVHFFGIPEHKEGSDARAFLRDFLSEVTGLVFSPLLEFQRATESPPL